jgi:hypothetical protein
MEYGGVSDDRPSDRPDGATKGVFGNLPDSRPGTRSPRRDAAAKGSARPRAQANASTAGPEPAAARSRPSGPEPRAEAPREPAPEPEEGREGAGLEDLAWAGIAAVAEAATIGVRLANRALEAALRKPPER